MNRSIVTHPCLAEVAGSPSIGYFRSTEPVEPANNVVAGVFFTVEASQLFNPAKTGLNGAQTYERLECAKAEALVALERKPELTIVPFVHRRHTSPRHVEAYEHFEDLSLGAAIERSRLDALAFHELGAEEICRHWNEAKAILTECGLAPGVRTTLHALFMPTRDSRPVLVIGISAMSLADLAMSSAAGNA